MFLPAKREVNGDGQFSIQRAVSEIRGSPVLLKAQGHDA